jgi:hypothetical protein
MHNPDMRTFSQTRIRPYTLLLPHLGETFRESNSRPRVSRANTVRSRTDSFSVLLSPHLTNMQPGASLGKSCQMSNPTSSLKHRVSACRNFLRTSAVLPGSVPEFLINSHPRGESEHRQQLIDQQLQCHPALIASSAPPIMPSILMPLILMPLSTQPRMRASATSRARPHTMQPYDAVTLPSAPRNLCPCLSVAY